MALTDNMRIDPRHIGITGLLSPGVAHCSGSRLEIFAKNISQTRVPNEPDFPDMFTGFETLFSDYVFDSTKRENEIRVFAIVDKYAMQLSTMRAGSNPLRTVVYRDLKTGEISYFNIHRFTSYTNDYGFENVMRSNIQVGDVIPPDMELYSSPSKNGDSYAMGVNANVAFTTILETTEDCFAMSESLAKRLSPLSIETKSISFNIRQYPLNLYGDEDQYKIFPDIGEFVNPDGILCAFRPVKKYSIISDLTPDKLTRVNHLFDQKVYAHPGAKVIDIEVYMNNKAELPERVYEQVRIYREARLAYWREIVNVYEKVKNLPISPKFNTLVTRAMGRLLAAKQSVPGIGKRSKIDLTDKFNPITLKVDITLAHRVIVNKGHKSSGREGGKGVVIIKPDEEMPIDEQGFRADICIDPISIIKRTNVIQLYEQYINRVLKWQAMNLDKIGTVEQQFRHIVELLNDINPEYAKLIAEEMTTKKLREQYVNSCKADTIKICIPPGMDNITKEMVLKLDEKYKTPISPVEFVINTSTGKKRVKTKDPVCIGSKYIYLLSKYPKPLAPGYGYVNRCHMPINTKDKNSTPLGTTPIRFGESESRIFAVALDIKTVLRFKCLYGGSRIGPKYMVEALVNENNPSQLKRVPVTTEVLYDDCPSVRIANHMFETIGIDVQNSLISADEAEKIFEELRSIL